MHGRARQRTALAASLLVFLLFPSIVCHADSASPAPFQGPADLRNQRPYQLLFLAFSPEEAAPLAAGKERVSVQLDIANNLLINSDGGVRVNEDTETQRVNVKRRWGLGRGYEASVSMPMMWRDGGFTDKLIANYHVLIGVTGPDFDIAPGRRYVRPYHSDIHLAGADGRTLVDAGPALGLGDFQATLKRGIAQGRWYALAGRVGVKLPTGSADDLIGSGGTDGGADLDASLALSHRVCLFTNVSYVWMQRDSHLRGLAQTHARRSMVAFEYYTNARTSWILQNEISDAAVRTGNPFVDGNQATLALVAKYKPDPLTTWTFGFTENGGLVSYQAGWAANIAPDPTFTFGWETQR
jgi:hypothetical protein